VSELTDLQDKQEITEICYRYGLVLDSRDWSSLSTVFTSDAEAYYLDMAPCIGYQAIEDTCSSALGALDRSQHLIGNVVVSLTGDDPDTAECICYLQAQHVKTGTDGGDNFIIAGRYLDRLVRTADGWRIKERRLEGMWTDGNPAVVGA
jgi:3-phenylpropionate/cinnamic acid dioxygenase small subunit